MPASSEWRTRQKSCSFIMHVPYLGCDTGRGVRLVEKKDTVGKIGFMESMDDDLLGSALDELPVEGFRYRAESAVPA